MKEDIIKMAQACWPSDRRMWAVDADLPRLERFAALVADRCAEIAYEAEPWHSADLIREAFGVKK
jgi:hypothetical protein